MTVEHDSRGEFYRNPFGAVTCGTKITIRLAVEGVGIPNAIRLVIKEDKGDVYHTDMPYIFEIDEHSIYSVDITAPNVTGLLWYYFEIETNQGTVYYGNNSGCLGGKGEIYFSVPEKMFQITVYSASYKTPEWFKEGVAYQIFPDRFYNGNEDGTFLGDRQDIIKRNWNETPFYKAEQFGGEYKANDFFGGNLKGIMKKLPYLQELGISVIYLNPIFKAYSNHKYDTGDYSQIDPMFGDEDTFKELCAEAKKLGIRIILDGVFNHTGDNSLYFNRYGEYDSMGAYQSEKSPYYSWYRFADWPEVYESWWGMKTLPQCEETSEEYRKYILSGKEAIVKKWIKNGASGWRLDVVDELPDFFVKELRKNVKSVDEDAVIIGEVWEDASNKVAYDERREYFLGDELDSVMNYPMRSALIDFALCRSDAAEFDEKMMSIKENYPKPAYYSLLNMVSGHDVERIMTLMGGAASRHEVDREYQANFELDGYSLETARRRSILVLALQMTLPGVPCIFYGDEIGVQGYGDPFCRSTFPWNNINEIDYDGKMQKNYKDMIHLRKSSKAFSKGEYKCAYKNGAVYGFIRMYDDEKYIVAVNTSSVNSKIRLDAARFGVHDMENVFCTEEVHKSSDGIFYVDVPAIGVKIFACK